MSILRILSLGTLFTLPLYVSVEMAEAGASKPVAIIYSLKGEATLPDAPRRSLRLFDRLPAGATLEVGPSSRLALAFMNGLRYELGQGSRVTLGVKDLASRTGLVNDLPRVPPLPRLAPIAEDDHPGPGGGAVPIRGERITGLYPRHGAAVLTEETVLRFQPVTGAGRYRIEVQDGEGEIVFQIDVESPPIKVPAGTLRTDHRYWWTVHTLDRPGAVARGEAELITLGEDAARMREEAREILESEGPDSLPLLAEIDRSLGLLREARAELQAALRTSPMDATLARALASLERHMKEEGFAPED